MARPTASAVADLSAAVVVVDRRVLILLTLQVALQHRRTVLQVLTIAPARREGEGERRGPRKQMVSRLVWFN